MLFIVVVFMYFFIRFFIRMYDYLIKMRVDLIYNRLFGRIGDSFVLREFIVLWGGNLGMELV